MDYNDRSHLSTKERDRLAHPTRPLLVQAIDISDTGMEGQMYAPPSPGSSSSISEWSITMPNVTSLLEALEAEHKVNRLQAAENDGLNDEIHSLRASLTDSLRQIVTYKESIRYLHAQHDAIESDRRCMSSEIERLDGIVRESITAPSPANMHPLSDNFDDYAGQHWPLSDLSVIIAQQSRDMTFDQLQQAAAMLGSEISSRQPTHRAQRTSSSINVHATSAPSQASSRNSSYRRASMQETYPNIDAVTHGIDRPPTPSLAGISESDAAYGDQTRRRSNKMSDRFKRRPKIGW